MSLFHTLLPYARAVALVTLLWGPIAACTQPQPAQCVDELCPVGQACEDGRCAPLQVPTELGDLGRFNAAAIDSEGHLVIATYDSTHGNLVLWRESDDGASTYILVDGFRVEEHAVVNTDSGLHPSLALASDNSVHVAWYDAANTELRYARIAEGEPWQIETVDGQGPSDRGRHNALALDEKGRAYIAYRDDTARGLRYAVRSSSGLWDSKAISGCASEESCPDGTDENYGEYASLALIAGAARIAFYDRYRGDLKLASENGVGEFTVTTLDGRDPESGIDTGDVGRFSSLAVDPKRRLAVAYFDASGKSLRYLFEGSGSLVPQLSLIHI